MLERSHGEEPSAARDPGVSAPLTAAAHAGAEPSLSATVRALAGSGAAGAGQGSAAPPGGTDGVLRLQRLAGNAAVVALLRQPATTGEALPAGVRRRAEEGSGTVLRRVQVHRSSPVPELLGAEAFAHGTDIHLAPGHDEHLPHEVGHVVQQLRGEVEADGRLAGVPVNRDPDLEHEADAGGPQATGATIDIDRVGAPVVQGKFERQVRNDVVVFVENKVLYRVETVVSNRRLVVVPMSSLSVTSPPITIVRARDGTWDREQPATNDKKRKLVPDDPESKMSSNGPSNDNAPNNNNTLGSDGDMVDGHASNTMGSNNNNNNNDNNNATLDDQPDDANEATSYLGDLGIDEAKLTSPFVAQVDLEPIWGTWTSGGLVYTLAEMNVPEIRVSNDRPPTFLPPLKSGSAAQGKHTVAFALVRRELAALGGGTAKELVDRLTAKLLDASTFVRGTEGAIMLASIGVMQGDVQATADRAENVDRLMNTIKGGAIRINVWQSLLSELVSTYVDLYHLSALATVAGLSKGRGESHALSALDAGEAAAEAGKKPDLGKCTKAATKLVDITQGAPVEVFVGVMKHWLEAMFTSHRQLMSGYGTQITSLVLGRKLATTYTEHMDRPGTVGSLLQAHGITVKGITTGTSLAPQGPSTMSDQTSTIESTQPTDVNLDTPFARFADGEESGFVASVGLDVPPPRRKESVGGRTGRTVTGVHPANEIEIRHVVISEVRPPTKYGSAGQKSHTVAWTLIRRQLLAFAGRPLAELVAFLIAELEHLLNDPLASELAQHARGQLQMASVKDRAVHLWQTDVSLAVMWYVHAHQLAESTTYVDLRPSDNHGRATGHGEGEAMDALTSAEARLDPKKPDIAMVRNVEGLAAKAGALLDVSSTLRPTLVREAYQRWLRALEGAFPALLAVMRDDIVAFALALNVGTEEAPRTLEEHLAMSDDEWSLSSGPPDSKKAKVKRGGRS